MKSVLLTLGLIFSICLYAQAQKDGKEIFAGNCKACHTIGGGTLLGPDLAGISERRDPEWIKEFITNSQKMIAAGDAAAVKVFNQFNKIPMPPHNFSDEDMNNLLAYMDEAGMEVSKASAQQETANTAVKEVGSPDGTNAQINNSPEMPWYFKTILVFLGITAVILIITAGYLYSLLRS